MTRDREAAATIRAGRGEGRVPEPGILCDTAAVAAAAGPDDAGAVWTLRPPERGLDANVVWLPPGEGIGRHDGPDLDVLLHVVRGSGHLLTERNALELRPGLLVWLPRRSRREFTAGPDGLAYLTVHQRRQPPALGSTSADGKIALI